MNPMRRIVMFSGVTADGYFAGPDGNLEWVVPDEQVDKAGAEAIPGFDTILFGRRTYEAFEGFWPHAVDDSPDAPDPHGAGRRSPTIRAMAIWITRRPKWCRRACGWNSWSTSGVSGSAVPTCAVD